MNEIKKTPAISPKVVFVLGILYILCPIDFAPDFLPVIGWCDDIGVLAYMVKTYKDWRQTVNADAYRVSSIE
jgi:uncharacterized membrane protein YkvA (DUF1232 family)